LTPAGGQTIELLIEPQAVGNTSLLALNREQVLIRATWLEQGDRDTFRVEWI